MAIPEHIIKKMVDIQDNICEEVLEKEGEFEFPTMMKMSIPVRDVKADVYYIGHGAAMFYNDDFILSDIEVLEVDEKSFKKQVAWGMLQNRMN